MTLAFLVGGEIRPRDAVPYAIARLAGALVGVLVAHMMFDLPLLQVSAKARSGLGQAFSEWTASFGLVATILITARVKPSALAASVGLYIAAAYWFTASTSFANPAVTIARAISDTFAGIRPQDVPLFAAAQAVGAMCTFAAAAVLAPRAAAGKASEGSTSG